MMPLMLDLRRRLCVVVGGGPVGLRKAEAFLQAGAAVRLVCLEERPSGATAEHLDWRTERYHARHLDGAFLAVAAAVPEVNRHVVADAKRNGVLVNAADAPADCDYFAPAVLRRGELVLAVSTGGAAPALARQLRQVLAGQVDQAFGDWVDLLREARPLIQRHEPDAARRRVLYDNLCDWAWLERLRSEGVEAVRRAMQETVAGGG
jgi:precorrin-2 dehydrogenase/sirohydrochlorin ferrochelatase